MVYYMVCSPSIHHKGSQWSTTWSAVLQFTTKGHSGLLHGLQSFSSPRRVTVVYYAVCSPLTHHYGPKRPTTGSAVLQLTMKRDDFLNVWEQGTCQFSHDAYVPTQHGAVEEQIQDLQVAQVGPLCVEQLCTTQHNTQASDTLQVGPLRVEQLCTTQHAGFRHTSGGPSLRGTALPSLCGTALYNTTRWLQTQSTHFKDDHHMTAV